VCRAAGQLGDLDAQFEQFDMDPGSAPERVLKAHSSDQVAHLLADPRPGPKRTGLPPPISGKTHLMSQGQDFGFQPPSRLEAVPQHADKEESIR
jgi:hypothetical protein